ncbi:hypothetical protein HYH03_005834 [Edaphochlamys debaryana]|uniref:Protein kinase domain-containing protein n=1 Tax=Edaphochlamys debaryana TaxID=47281 RepID=A0A835Y8N0_9CHLO|nr:hypothetical protein HYH03_005834 [Edaphochlamys debaryana]|eukprot:KAG2496236.1 hypothetical protein HYH03_005834 [Edaphochlamys debaryana]
MPQPPAPMTAPPPALLEPPASLVEQMMRTKAPVIRNPAEPVPPCASSCGVGAGTTADYGALLPLTGAGQKVVGALWITRPPADGNPSGAATALLQRPAALQQLGLCVSALLLASAQDCQHMAAVSEGLHALASAASVQQLLAALGGAVERHVRQRYLLAPRVVTALVPERGADVGLFLGWGDAADAQSPAAPGTPQRHRKAGASVSFRLSRAATSSALQIETEGGLTAPAASRGSRPAARSTSSHAPVTVSLGGGTAAPAGGSRQDMARAAVRNAQMTTMMRAASLAAPKMPKEALPARASQPQATLSTCPGGGAGPSSDHVVADGGSDCGDTTASAPCNILCSTPSLLPLSPLALAALEAAGAAAAMGPALRAKPFTLAQTLLRQLLTSASEPGAAASEGDGGGGAPSASLGGVRPQALAVEDGVSLLQDPKQPSRDVLLLLAGTGQQARAKLGSPAKAFGRSVADNAEGSLGASGGALAVRSLLLLTLPAGPGSGGAALGLYVVFPQRLPMALLAEARASLLELGEMVAPAVFHKLSQDLAFELKTIATAAPGLYAVTPSGQPVSGTFAAAGPASVGATGPTSGGWAAPASFQSPVGSQAGRRRPADVAADWLLPESGMGTAAVKMALQDAGGSGSSGDGEADVADFSLDSLPNNAANSAALIRVEGLTADASMLRSQMPLLVATLQSSINNARAEASVAAAAAAAAASARTSSESAAVGHRGSARKLGQLGNHGGANTAGNSDLERIEIVSQLGFGGCAIVFKARMGPLDVAVKADGRGSFGEERSSAGAAAPSEEQVEKNQLEARRALLRNAMEVAAMTSLSGHPNVMALYEAHSNVVLMRKDLPNGSARLRLQSATDTMESNIPGGSPLCVALVCEWCDRGCLASTLVEMGDSIREESRAAAAQQAVARPVLNLRFILMTLLDVAMALRHLHSHNLIHRDLKPANVLLSSSHTDPRGFVAKLADFGFVTILDQPGDEESGGQPWALAEEMCGTITHMAPESLRKPARLGPSCDVFSFGILMWELTAFGSRPYPEVPLNNITTFVKAGGRPRFSPSVLPAYRRLAAQCWEADPLKRPNAAALVAAISNMLEGMP